MYYGLIFVLVSFDQANTPIWLNCTNVSHYNPRTIPRGILKFFLAEENISYDLTGWSQFGKSTIIQCYTICRLDDED